MWRTRLIGELVGRVRDLPGARSNTIYRVEGRFRSRVHNSHQEQICRHSYTKLIHWGYETSRGCALVQGARVASWILGNEKASYLLTRVRVCLEIAISTGYVLELVQRSTSKQWSYMDIGGVHTQVKQGLLVATRLTYSDSIPIQAREMTSSWFVAQVCLSCASRNAKFVRDCANVLTVPHEDIILSNNRLMDQ